MQAKYLHENRTNKNVARFLTVVRGCRFQADELRDTIPLAEAGHPLYSDDWRVVAREPSQITLRRSMIFPYLAITDGRLRIL